MALEHAGRHVCRKTWGWLWHVQANCCLGLVASTRDQLSHGSFPVLGVMTNPHIAPRRWTSQRANLWASINIICLHVYHILILWRYFYFSHYFPVLHTQLVSTFNLGFFFFHVMSYLIV